MFTSRQWKLLIGANVIIALLLGLYFGLNIADTAPASGKPYIHQIIRPARTSTNSSIEWEINIGGSDNDTAVQAFYEEDRIVVFGNTLSSDYDFAEAGVFMAVLSSEGDTESFTTIATSTTLVMAVISETGYLLGCEYDGTVTLYSIDSEGGIVYDKNMVSPVSGKHLTLSTIFIDTTYTVVVSEKDLSTQKISLQVYSLDHALATLKFSLINSAFSLTFVGLFQYGNEWLLFCAYDTTVKKYAVIVRVTIGATHAITEINIDFNYRLTDVTAIGKNDYAMMVIDSEANTKVIRVSDYPAELNMSTHYLKTTNCHSGKIVYGGGNFYALSIGKNNTIKQLDANLNIKSGFNDTYPKEYIPTAVISEGGIVVIALQKPNSTILLHSGTSATLGVNGDLIGSSATDNQIVIMNVRDELGDIGGNLGKQDIWIARITSSKQSVL